MNDDVRVDIGWIESVDFLSFHCTFWFLKESYDKSLFLDFLYSFKGVCRAFQYNGDQGGGGEGEAGRDAV